MAAAFERLGEFATVAVFDRRGSGLSDPMAGAPTLEEQMDDVLAVMDAVGFERAAVSATLEGGPDGRACSRPPTPTAASAWSSTRPSPARRGRPTTTSTCQAEERERARSGSWWTTGGRADGRRGGPEPQERPGLHGVGRAGSSAWPPAPPPRRRILDLIGQFDVRHVLPSIRVPDPGHAPPRRRLPRRAPLALPGRAHPRMRATWSSRAPTTCSRWATSNALIGEIEEFLTGERQEREPDRMLATVLFTDICRSTERAAEMGDSAWRRPARPPRRPGAARARAPPRP